MNLALPLLLATQAQAAERRYALSVGANRGDADEVQLLYAERDAERVGRLLVNMAGVKPEDLILLTEDPAAGELRSTLISLRDRLASEAVEGTEVVLFVYYSGHSDDEALHLRGTRMQLDELHDTIEHMPVAVRVLLVDACKAGELTRMKGAVPAQPFEITVADELATAGMAVITSSAAGEDAQESDRLQGGVFTHHLLAGLAGAADTSGDRRVSLTEAYHYTYARTLMATSNAPAIQHPSYSFDLQGSDDLILTAMDDASKMGLVRLELAGNYVVFEPRGTDLVTEVEVAQGGLIALPQGDYLVRRRLPDRVYEGTVSVTTGQQVTIAGTDLDAMPYGQTARRGTASQQPGATALVAGGGLSGALGEGLNPATGALLGLRIDRPALTFMVRASGEESTTANEDLSLRQQQLGLDAAALRFVELGPISPGAGLRVGTAGVWQRFETTGLAPERQALIGTAGPVLRLEWAALPRVAVGLDGGADIALVPAEDGVAAAVRPTLNLDVSLWLF